MIGRWMLEMTRRFDRHVGKRLFRRELRALLVEEPIDVVLDVGAHRGDYAASLRDMGYEGRMLSFEPVEENAALVGDRARVDDEWRVRQTALGARDRRLPLRVSRRTDFSSFRAVTEYGRSEWASQTDVREEREVRVRRLDGLWPEIVPEGSHVLLKIDTQGFEREVLEGAGARLSEIRALQLEVPIRPIYDRAASYGELFGYLDARGFLPIALFPISRDRDGRLVEMDCLLVRTPDPGIGGPS